MSDDCVNSEEDINDVFDKVAFSEEQISNKAFDEGLIKGKEDGYFEGYHLGFHRGLELGSEIGFYIGLTKVLINNISAIAVENTEKYEKIDSVLKKLTELLKNFPRQNNEDVNLLDTLNKIRASYRKLNSLLKLNLSFQTTPEMSF